MAYDITLYSPLILLNPATGGQNIPLGSNLSLAGIQQVYPGSSKVVGDLVVYDSTGAYSITDETGATLYLINESKILFKENIAP
jgi:hypothetical protein